VRQSAGPIPEKAARAEGKHIISDARLRFSVQNIDAFVPVVMMVKFGGLVAWVSFYRVKAKTSEPCHIAERSVHSPRIRAEVMRFFRPLDSVDF